MRDPDVDPGPGRYSAGSATTWCSAARTLIENGAGQRVLRRIGVISPQKWLAHLLRDKKREAIRYRQPKDC